MKTPVSKAEWNASRIVHAWSKAIRLDAFVTQGTYHFLENELDRLNLSKLH